MPVWFTALLAKKIDNFLFSIIQSTSKTNQKQLCLTLILCCFLFMRCVRVKVNPLIAIIVNKMAVVLYGVLWVVICSSYRKG